MRRVFAAFGVCAVVALTGAPPIGAAPAAPSLPQDKITLELEGNETSATTQLLVSNKAEAGIVTVQFVDGATGRSLPLQHGRDATSRSYRSTLPAHRVTSITLKVTVGHSAVDGHVLVQPSGGTPAITAFETARRPETRWLWLPIAGSAFAFFLVVLAWVVPRGSRGRLFDSLGVAADWKFDSWASNLTALGAVAGTVLGLSGFLDDVLHGVVVTRFVGLDALFLALVAAAPLVFAAGAKRRAKRRVGTIAGFLLASWLTLTAAFGELIVLGLMLYMARGDAGTWFIASLLMVAALVLVVYGWRSIGDTVTHRRSHTRRGSRTKPLTRSQARADPSQARLRLL
jgi:hypothetical protein